MAVTKNFKVQIQEKKNQMCVVLAKIRQRQKNSYTALKFTLALILTHRVIYFCNSTSSCKFDFLKYNGIALITLILISIVCKLKEMDKAWMKQFTSK